MSATDSRTSKAWCDNPRISGACRPNHTGDTIGPVPSVLVCYRCNCYSDNTSRSCLQEIKGDNTMATLSVPPNRFMRRSLRLRWLPDVLARFVACRFARLLSERDGFVVVRYRNNKTMVVGFDTHRRQPHVGWLSDMSVIRRSGGFREYANDVIRGPIL